MSVISASSRWVSLEARAVKSRRVSASIWGSSSASSSARSPVSGRPQLVGDVGDELRAQLLVVGGLAGVGEEHQRLPDAPDLVGLHRHPVGPAAVRRTGAPRSGAARGRRGRPRSRPASSVLAEGLERAHPRHEEREALDGEEVRLHQPPGAVQPHRHQRQVLEHLPPPPLRRLGGRDRPRRPGRPASAARARAPPQREGAQVRATRMAPSTSASRAAVTPCSVADRAAAARAVRAGASAP